MCVVSFSFWVQLLLLLFSLLTYFLFISWFLFSRFLFILHIFHVIFNHFHTNEKKIIITPHIENARLELLFLFLAFFFSLFCWLCNTRSTLLTVRISQFFFFIFSFILSLLLLLRTRVAPAKADEKANSNSKSKSKQAQLKEETESRRSRGGGKPSLYFVFWG